MSRQAYAEMHPIRIARYKTSLKWFMGYRADGHWATAFDLPAVEILGALIDPEQAHLQDFMRRYRRVDRPWRETEVKQVICLWLSEFAAGLVR